MAATNPWLGRRVLAYAHQGGAWEAPSSTLYAIGRALEAGATGIELDVHATADRQLVVTHDETVDRTTDGSGVIADLTLVELERLDNAYWFIPGADVTPGRPGADYPYRGRAPADPVFGVAPLPAVLELLEDWSTVALNLDIKRTAPAVEPYEELLAAALERHRYPERVIVASFLDAATDAFAKAAPEVATSFGTVGTAEFYRAVHAGEEPAPSGHVALQVPEHHGDLTVVDAPFVDAAHRAGVAVHVWTVNDTDAMARLLDLGVDGIISDLPTTLVGVLRERGLTYTPPGHEPPPS